MNNIRRFTAENSRNALRQVREALGGDAIILSNRSVDGGVEIVAAPAAAVEALTRPRETAVVAATTEAPAAASRHKLASMFARRTATKSEKATDKVVDSAPRAQVAAAAQAYADTFADHLAAAREADDFVTRIAPEAVALARPEPVLEPVPPTVAVELAPVAVEAIPAAPVEELSAAVKREVSEEVSRGIARELGRDVVLDVTRDIARDVTRDVTQQVSSAMARRFQALHAELNEKLSTVSWTDAMRRQPGRTKLMRDLILAGFSPALSRHIQSRLPDDFSNDEARSWAQGILKRNLPVASDADELVNHGGANGGVYALVGPTGVGKTTTVAKLAARFAMKHGIDQLALITTDGFRIGAQDQLRIYGKILGIPVHSIHDASSLASALVHLRDKRLVLIDTAGLGMRDERVTEQIAMLRGAKAKRLVVLDATADVETLDQVVATFADRDFAGCVVTKTDEAVRLGPVLDVVIRHRLRIHHVSTGQRVPEDLERPDADALVARALLRPTSRRAFEVAEDIEPVWMSAMVDRAHAIEHPFAIERAGPGLSEGGAGRV